ncbi:MAG: hypothetical protein LBM16_03490 [Clostridiales bacterium]|jgi:hypothetical protein|nr:hypothetical protein [Clostridiales bacterium]
MIFSKFYAFVKRFFYKRSKKRKIALHSRFGHLLETLDPISEEYHAAEEAVRMCDESVSLIAQRLMALDKIKEMEAQIAELECFNSMSDEDSEVLRAMLDRLVSAGREKNNLKYRLTDFDASLITLQEHEEEAPKAANQIADAEEMQRIFKHDMDYLLGEKEGLDYEKHILVRSSDFIYKFTVLLTILFGMVFVGLFAVFALKGVDVFTPVAIIAILIIILISLIYVLRRRIRRDLLMNYKKQEKAVKLLNRKTTVYAYYTNFLNNQYKKYKVKNAEMLKANIKDYDSYKTLAKRFDSLRSLIGQTEVDVTRMLREYGISNINMTLENFAKTFSIEDKKAFYKELFDRKAQTEAVLTTLDEQQEQIWDALIFLDEHDTSEGNVIGAIIALYMTHVSEMIANPKKLNKEEIDAGEE